MPYWRLMYDWDNNYTKKEKRMILLTQEAIDKINGLTPGGWAEYTAGSWIAISAQNVISNTKQFDPTNTWTTWQVLKKIGNSYSWANAEWWAMFVTQEEYDALPASKTTDGKEYIIVDSHWFVFYPFEELKLLANARINILSVLNWNAQWYATYYESTWDVTSEDFVASWNRDNPWNQLPTTIYIQMYEWSIFNCRLIYFSSNATLQDLTALEWGYDDYINHILLWDWYIDCML